MRHEHSTRATRLSLLYFALATATLVWPIYPWFGNRIEPRVLGLPWSLAWVLIVIVCNFAVLLVLFRLRVIDDREIDDGAAGAITKIPTADHHEPPLAPGPELAKRAAQTKTTAGGT